MTALAERFGARAEKLSKAYGECRIKDVGTIVRDGVQKGVVPFAISTPRVDRDGEVVQLHAWQKWLPEYQRNPIMTPFHHLDVPAIGNVLNLRIVQAEKSYDGDGTFDLPDPFSALMFGKFERKVMRAFSPGFLVHKTGRLKDGTPTVEEAEHVETAACNVPSGRDALTRALRDDLELAEKALRFAADEEEPMVPSLTPRNLAPTLLKIFAPWREAGPAPVVAAIRFDAKTWGSEVAPLRAWLKEQGITYFSVSVDAQGSVYVNLTSPEILDPAGKALTLDTGGGIILELKGLRPGFEGSRQVQGARDVALALSDEAAMALTLTGAAQMLADFGRARKTLGSMGRRSLLELQAQVRAVLSSAGRGQDRSPASASLATAVKDANAVFAEMAAFAGRN